MKLGPNFQYIKQEKSVILSCHEKAQHTNTEYNAHFIILYISRRTTYLFIYISYLQKLHLND
jgi:hypothetical protein